MRATKQKSTDLESLQKTGERLGLGLQDLADIVGVDQSTLYRWRQGTSAPRAIVLTRMEQIGEAFAMLRRLFQGPDLARQWLHESKPASLGGDVTPLEVMRAGRVDRVLMLLHTLAAGG
jgi:transcriptional regulator with XRE-family HTH domain